MTFYVTSPNFDVLSLIIIFLLAKNHRENILTRTISTEYENGLFFQDFILGGDFNAGCNYVRPGDWDSIRLRQQSRFLWVIGDDADTTIATSQCPYDRYNLIFCF